MNKKKENPPAQGAFLLYESQDGQIKLDVRLENESLWLTQPMIATLFQTTQQNTSQHILNIYKEGELSPEATHKKFLSVRKEGSRQVQRELEAADGKKYLTDYWKDHEIGGVVHFNHAGFNPSNSFCVTDITDQSARS